MEEENKKSKKVAIETYAEDVASVVGNNESGIVKKIIEEEEVRNVENKKISIENNTSKTFLFIGIFLLIVSVLLIFLVFFFRKEIFTVEITPQYIPIIFIDKTEFKEISELKKDEIIQTVSNEEKISDLNNGGVKGIYLTENKKVLGFRKFLDLIKANLDKNKIEFINDNFLIGVENRSLFFLLKMRSIADVFSPMKNWENKMFYDLHGFFGIDLNLDTKYLLEKNFEDGIVQNKNARILYDKDGKIVMMYVFAEADSLIITNSEDTVAEVMLRLVSSQIKK